jgi:hypothetical protein
MSFLIANGYLTAACGGAVPPRKPAVSEESDPPIRVDEPGTEPEPEEDPDWNKKGGPGAGGGYLAPPTHDAVVLSPAARSKR